MCLSQCELALWPSGTNNTIRLAHQGQNGSKVWCPQWSFSLSFCIYCHGLESIIESIYCSATDRGVRSIVMSVSVCLCVCLSAITSPELQVRSSGNFLCVLPMAVARSSHGVVVICYVFPVLLMMSYLHISWGCLTSPTGWGSEAHTQPWAWCVGIPVAGSGRSLLLLAVRAC